MVLTGTADSFENREKTGKIKNLVDGTAGSGDFQV